MNMNIRINMEVILTTGYTGDWKTALKEGYSFSRKLGVPVRLSYAGQKSWNIYLETTEDEIDSWTKERICIGV